MRRIGLVAAVALAWAGQASATIITTTYQGTVFSGIDALGLFGAAGADLAGDSFSSVVAFDSAVSPQVDSRGLSSLGGTAYGAPNPFVSASLTIAGGTYNITGADFLGSFAVFHDYTADGLETAGAVSVMASENSTVALSALYFSIVAMSGPGLYPEVGGAVSFDTIYAGVSDFKPPGTLDALMLVTTSATIDPAPTLTFVPEPETWGLMLLGFGLAGTMLRARRPSAFRPGSWSHRYGP